MRLGNRSVTRPALVSLALTLGAATAAEAQAQGWAMEPVPPDGARAFVEAGGARFEFSCRTGATGPETRFVYLPSDLEAVSLRSESINGQGPEGNGEDDGYLFLRFADTSVQQFVTRDAVAGLYASDQVGDALVGLLQSGSAMQVMPHLFSEEPYDSFSLSGSARAITAALDACVPELLPPQLPDGSSLARVGGVDAFLDDASCRRVMLLRVVAPAASVFSELPAVLDQLVAEVRRPVLELCPNTEQIRIAGYAGGEHVYDGVAARVASWVLIDLAQPGEALVPHGPPPAEPAGDDQAETESVADAAAPPEDAVGDDQQDAPTVADAGLPPAEPAGEEPPLAQDVADAGAPAVAAADEEQPETPVADEEQAEAPVVDEEQPETPVADDARPESPVAAEAGPACPDPAAPGAYATPGAASNLQSGDYVFSDQDDVVLLAATARAASGRSGNDLFYLFPESGLAVYGQAGADTFVLCRLDAPEVAIGLDYSGLTLNDAPDTVVIDAAVLGAADGRPRDVNVFGFYPAIDRLILRVPAGVALELPADTSRPTIVVRAGDVTIGLRRADDVSATPFNPASIVIVEVDGS